MKEQVWTAWLWIELVLKAYIIAKVDTITF